MNDVHIGAGPAIQEYASMYGSQDEALAELSRFQSIFEYYPCQLWLRVAEEQMTEIPPMQYTNVKAENITARYDNGSDHFLMTYATMLHIVTLLRTRGMSPKERFMNLVGWSYDNLQIGQYILVYAAMLFTNQEHIKCPKGVMANDIDKIIKGCKNQVWDITYLSSWSVFI